MGIKVIKWFELFSLQLVMQMHYLNNFILNGYEITQNEQKFI